MSGRTSPPKSHGRARFNQRTTKPADPAATSKSNHACQPPSSAVRSNNAPKTDRTHASVQAAHTDAVRTSKSSTYRIGKKQPSSKPARSSRSPKTKHRPGRETMLRVGIPVPWYTRAP